MTGRAGATFRALRAGWRAEIAAAAEYRTDLVVGVLSATFWLGFAIAPVLVLFEHVDTAQGWTRSQLLLVQAVWTAIDAVVWMFLVPNLGRWSDDVRSGQLDMILLKPVDSLTIASIGSLNVQNIPKLVLAFGLGVVAFATNDGDGWSAPALLAGAAATVFGLVIIWSFGVLASVKAITSVRFDATFALHTGHNLARVPTPFYGTAVRFVLTVIVPVAFLTTIPVEVLTGSASLWLAVVAGGVAALMTVIARGAWSHQVRRYSGAAS